MAFACHRRYGLATGYSHFDDVWRNGQPRDRKLAHATTLVQRFDGACGESPAYAIKYHHTDIVTFYKNGDVGLDSGNYNTISTRARMNDYIEPLGWHVNTANFGGGGRFRQSGVWMVYRLKGKVTSRYDWPGIEEGEGDVEGVSDPNSGRYYFADGITLKPDGAVENEGTNVEKEIAEQKQARLDEERAAVDYLRKHKINKGDRVTFTALHAFAHYNSEELALLTSGSLLEGGNFSNTKVVDEGFRFLALRDPCKSSANVPEVVIVNKYPCTEESNRWCVYITSEYLPDVGVCMKSARTLSMAIQAADEQLRVSSNERESFSHVKAKIAERIGARVEKFAHACTPRFYWAEHNVWKEHRTIHDPADEAATIREYSFINGRTTGKEATILEQTSGYTSVTRFKVTVALLMLDEPPRFFDTLSEAKEFAELTVRTAAAFKRI